MYTIHIDNLSDQSDYTDLISSHIQDRSISIAFCYNSDFKNTHAIRRLVESICTQLWVDEQWMHRIVLMVDELNNNAIEHGSQQSTQNEMRIEISRQQQEYTISIECEDSWTGPSPKAAVDMEILHRDVTARGFKNHHSIRWRGLFLIIDQIVDSLYFKDSEKWGLIVWIQKKIALSE